MRNIFNETKKLLKLKTGGQPTSFLVAGRLIKKPSELANIQIEYYTMKIQKLMGRLSGIDGDPLDYLKMALQRWQQGGNIPKFSFREVTLLETIKIIGKLSSSTSCGKDEIDSLAVKLAVETLANPTRHIINNSLLGAQFANKWKIAKTVPLLKNNECDKLDPGSYRPVALLSTISKVVERVAQCQLLEYFETTGKLNTNCHAYRKELSTTTTLLQIMDGLYAAAEDRKVSQLMATNQSSAFDCVRHNLFDRKVVTIWSG